MKISKQFEYKDSHNGATFVTIIDEFEHHYTHTKMFRVRIEYVGSVFNYPMVKYDTWTEKEMAVYFDNRVKE